MLTFLRELLAESKFNGYNADYFLFFEISSSIILRKQATNLDIFSASVRAGYLASVVGPVMMFTSSGATEDLSEEVRASASWPHPNKRWTNLSYNHILRSCLKEEAR